MYAPNARKSMFISPEYRTSVKLTRPRNTVTLLSMDNLIALSLRMSLNALKTTRKLPVTCGLEYRIGFGQTRHKTMLHERTCSGMFWWITAAKSFQIQMEEQRHVHARHLQVAFMKKRIL